MGKSRKLGFLDYRATDDSFFDLFTRLREAQLIPQGRTSLPSPGGGVSPRALL